MSWVEITQPVEIVKGAMDAISKRKDIKIFLVGQENVVQKELEKYTYDKEQIEVVDAPEVIETAEPPVMAIRKKKQSSIVVAMNMVKKERRMHLSLPEVQGQFLSEDSF